MSKLRQLLLIVVLVIGAYWTWSFFVSSRYQALCGASYWQMTHGELNACKDVATELTK